VAQAGIGGSDGAPIDHIELSGPPARADADARNFVLCPGGAYDRSPCGTGTSATMAARYARGQLALGIPWRQESITGSLFEGVLARRDGLLIPNIRGRAYVIAEATLLLDPADPLRYGFPTDA
jgi:4-hydroxyproline epimerase